MARARKTTRWADTPAGQTAYIAARAKAQAAANADGFDRGLEVNEIFREYTIRMLPQRRNRFGHELRCEVVSCENIDRCQPGHGPVGRV